MVKVSAAIVTHKNKILLFLRDDKPTIKDPNRWSLIGGHVEEGEDHDQGLLRELQEEISVTPSNYSLIMKSPGHWQEEIHLYHIPLSDEEAARIKLGDEGQKVEFFELKDMDNLSLSTNLDTFYKNFKNIFEQALSNK